MKEIYSPREVSEICRVSAETVENWLREKRLPAFSVPGGHSRVEHEHLKRFMAENGVEAPAGWEQSLAKYRVLAVEDDVDLLDIIYDLLGEEPRIEARKEDNGISAELQIASWHPDLVLLDFVMPGVSGFEICKKMRADPSARDIPVLAVTSLCLPENRKAVLESGISDFLAKPFYSEELLKRVRTLLGIEDRQRWAA